MATIELTIDNQAVQVEKGATVLEAAKAAGIEIPTLCTHEKLPNYGACRLCIVEIEGMRGFPTSCTTPAENGMVVKTQSEELKNLRNRILQLMLSNHPNACLVCDHREDCEKYRPRPTKAGKTSRCAFCSNRDECSVRQMALQIEKHDLKLPVRYSFHALERDDPFMDRDHNLCLLCGKCWRICEEVHGKPAISITDRGRTAKFGTAFDKSYTESGCTFCGACIDICPSGTLTDRFARWRGVPDRTMVSACTICPEGCKMSVAIGGKKVVATHMVSLDRDSRLCAVGRFAYPLIVNTPNRLLQAAIEEGGELVPVSWDEALQAVSAKLKGFAKGQSVVVVGEAETRETKFLYERLAKDVLGAQLIRVPGGGALDESAAAALLKDVEAGKIKAAVVAGNFLSPEILEKLEYVVVADFLPSASSERANAVLPTAILAETSGTYRDAAGEVKYLGLPILAPGEAQAEWQVIRDLATAMGAEDFKYDELNAVTKAIGEDAPPAAISGSPRDCLKDVPTHFRGHLIADLARALEAIGLPSTPKPPAPKAKGGFKVVDVKEVVPNFYRIDVEAPAIAKYAKPGQFAILMVEETSERAPFTLIDWDAEKGIISLIVEEVGRSSRELVSLKPGDNVAHVSGPLGTPYPIEKVGTIALGGGCFGLGAIYPIARAMKEAGNKVICAIEASTRHLLYMEDELSAVSDELIISTKDGSRGRKGGVQEVLVDLAKRATPPDAMAAIGCSFMMRMVSEKTRDLGIPLQVALKTIMVDGTGMCGACRVSVNGETKFACVDGPFFDGHAVDWDELGSRLKAFFAEEVDALPQTTEEVGAGCGSKHHHG